jgi:hypothetical protein
LIARKIDTSALAVGFSGRKQSRSTPNKSGFERFDFPELIR